MMEDDAGLLEGLLKAYSPTGSESGAVEYLVSQMLEIGFKASVDGAGNAVGTIGDGPSEIILLGHIDTVPGLIPIRREGDRLYGRGAADAKGPLACYATAAARAKIGSGWRVTVVGAVAEEGDSHGARYVVSRYAPQFAIIGEPSGWDHITLGYKGTLWVRFSLKLPMAHTSIRQPSACEWAVDYWNRLLASAEAYNADKSKVFDQITPTLRGMHSGSDGFSETAELSINLRLPPGLSVESAAEMVSRIAREGNLTFEDSPVPAFRADKNNPLVRAFLASIRQAGGNPGFLLKSGTADMNIVGPAWGCPVLAYGPGDSDLDHTPDEHILLAEYFRSIEVLTSLLERLTH